MEINNRLTIKSAEAKYGIPRHTIRRAINEHKISAIKIGAHWEIFIPSLERYIQSLMSLSIYDASVSNCSRIVNTLKESSNNVSRGKIIF